MRRQANTGDDRGTKNDVGATDMDTAQSADWNKARRQVIICEDLPATKKTLFWSTAPPSTTPPRKRSAKWHNSYATYGSTAIVARRAITIMVTT